MPACTAFGVKSRISVALRTGVLERVVESPEPPAPQPAAIAARTQPSVSLASMVRPIEPGQDMRFVEWAARMRRRVTFSRNLTLSLSRTCRCYCKYCAFATHRAHLYSPDEVEARLDEAVRRNAKELLVLTGERPDDHPSVRARLQAWGHEDFVAYVVWA